MEKRSFSRHQMLAFLDRLEASSEEISTISFRPGTDVQSLASLITSFSGTVSMPGGAIEAASSSSNGGVVFCGRPVCSMVLPPFPVVSDVVAQGLETSVVRSLLTVDLTTAIILIRMGQYAVGVFRGEGLLSGKVGTGLVHSRHRQGGSSSRRFERHRDKQVETFFGRVCGHARERLEPHISDIDLLAYGGERFTVLDFRKQCQFLERFDDRVIPRLLDVRQPRQDSLEKAIRDIWSSTIIEWDERDFDAARR